MRRDGELRCHGEGLRGIEQLYGHGGVMRYWGFRRSQCLCQLRECAVTGSFAVTKGLRNFQGGCAVTVRDCVGLADYELARRFARTPEDLSRLGGD